jgi:hypothetical protein
MAKTTNKEEGSNPMAKTTNKEEGRDVIMETKKITASVGQPVQIKLQSMAGSTGYSWYLTELDGGLVLSSAIVVPTAPGIAPVNHVFDFLAEKAGSFKVVFELKAAWRPGEKADTEVFEVEISEKKKTPQEDIEAAMAGREFVKASATSVGAQVENSQILKYAAPMSAATSIVYAAPMAQPVPQNGPQLASVVAATMIAYAAPIGPSTVAFRQPPAVDPCLTCPPPVGVQILYAAPWTGPQQPPVAADPCQCSPVNALCPSPCPGPLPKYAAPMPGGMRYAAPWPGGPIMRYAAPWPRDTAGPDCC